jgi:hypothetical protein
MIALHTSAWRHAIFLDACFPGNQYLSGVCMFPGKLLSKCIFPGKSVSLRTHVSREICTFYLADFVKSAISMLLRGHCEIYIWLSWSVLWSAFYGLCVWSLSLVFLLVYKCTRICMLVDLRTRICACMCASCAYSLYVNDCLNWFCQRGLCRCVYMYACMYICMYAFTHAYILEILWAPKCLNQLVVCNHNVFIRVHSRYDITTTLLFGCMHVMTWVFTQIHMYMSHRNTFFLNETWFAEWLKIFVYNFSHTSGPGLCFAYELLCLYVYVHKPIHACMRLFLI